MARRDPGSDDLPRAEFAFPGELRDRLVSTILSGAKTSTSSLTLDYEVEGETMPVVGARSVVVDSENRPVAIIEVTEVRVLRAADVDPDFAREEGEGFATVAEWRAAHERFWSSREYRDWIGRPDFVIDDDTLVVAERFRVVERLG